MINKYIEDTYPKCDERVQTFLSRVYDDCVNANQNLSNYFYVCLDLLCTQVKLYFMALDIIDKEKELSSEDAYKRMSKHPALQVLNNAHKEILNILSKLSLSPFDQAKLKRLNNGEDDGSAEELLNSLVN